MRKIIMCVLALFVASCAVVPPQNATENPFLDNALFCNVDADCTCGGLVKQTGDCFIGNKLYQSMHVDTSKQCPDFCTGIAGNLEVKCVDQVCKHVAQEMVACTEEAKLCPDGSAVGRTGPNCEFAPCPGESVKLTVREVMWSSFPAKTEEIINIVDAVPGVSFGSNPHVPDDAFRIIEVIDGKVRISVDSKNYVACGEPISSSRVREEWILSDEGLCFRTRSLDGGYDYYLSIPECFSDSDCVPATCCHSSWCTIKSAAPNCAGTVCTENCEPGTLDCGGSCACVDGKCQGRNYFSQ
ncbi:hypothetical protein KY329_05310 [Candidatus Woesearchaeota archaeon]|nr:hypothetical protein [Candidatus Woesearchaeota archaeon]